MKNIVEVEINVPQEKLAALLGDPSNSQEWMAGLESYKPLSGKPGQVGASYQLAFKNGKRLMVFTATTTKRDLPHELRISMDSAMVQIEAIATLTAVSPTQTKYTFEQNFHFKGLVNKIMGALVQGTIKNQQRKDVEGFKRFAEQSS
jgi:hypothetical protein